MKRKIETIIGVFVGVIAPIFAMVMFFEIKPEYKMYDNFDPESFKELLFKISFFGLLLNVGIFFAALKFNKDSLAQGVLYATFFTLVASIVYRFVL